MKKLAVIALTTALVLFIWHGQSAKLHSVFSQNQRLAETAAELTAKIQAADLARQTAEQQFLQLSNAFEETEINPSAATTQAAPVDAMNAPEPARHGGWPKGAAFIYLPKDELTNASYSLLKGDSLTDEAAALLALSGKEREDVDRAFSELLGQFRHVEAAKMRLVDPPAGWLTAGNSGAPSAVQFDSALTYHVPDLSSDIDASRKTFSDRLMQAIGPYRSRLIETSADTYLRDNMDDLGSGDRTIGFMWQREQDGTASLWYGIADARHGAGSFQRVSEDLDPNSQTAYYANLFGVKLPRRN